MCDHKYVHIKNESYYEENGRYAYLYVSIDYFFCERCLDEQTKRKAFHVSNSMLHTLPDWAKTITKKIYE